jgi:hypothetical protein
MRIHRTGEIYYPGGQIYSVDIHPDGRFLATCGVTKQGHGLVSIWDLLACENSSNSNDDNLPASNDENQAPDKASEDENSMELLPADPNARKAEKSVEVSQFLLGQRQVFNSELHYL